MSNGYDLSKYGYKSRAAFLRDVKPHRDTFFAIALDESWPIKKSVLLHPGCPIEIRDRFAKDPIWYVRLVAIFATKAPEGYIDKAAADPDKRVQNAYARYLKAKNAPAPSPES
jgi:hypothetical protein